MNQLHLRLASAGMGSLTDILLACGIHNLQDAASLTAKSVAALPLSSEQQVAVLELFSNIDVDQQDGCSTAAAAAAAAAVNGDGGCFKEGDISDISESKTPSTSDSKATNNCMSSISASDLRRSGSGGNVDLARDLLYLDDILLSMRISTNADECVNGVMNSNINDDSEVPTCSEEGSGIGYGGKSNDNMDIRGEKTNLPFSDVEDKHCCFKCGITCFEGYIEVIGKRWHKDCFVCISCGCDVSAEEYKQNDDGLIYCKKHFGNVKCENCGFIVNSEYHAVNEYQFHPGCLQCHRCHSVVEIGDSFSVSLDAGSHLVECHKCVLNTQSQHSADPQVSRPDFKAADSLDIQSVGGSERLSLLSQCFQSLTDQDIYHDRGSDAMDETANDEKRRSSNLDTSTAPLKRFFKKSASSQNLTDMMGLLDAYFEQQQTRTAGVDNEVDGCTDVSSPSASVSSLLMQPELVPSGSRESIPDDLLMLNEVGLHSSSEPRPPLALSGVESNSSNGVERQLQTMELHNDDAPVKHTDGMALTISQSPILNNIAKEAVRKLDRADSTGYENSAGSWDGSDICNSWDANGKNSFEDIYTDSSGIIATSSSLLNSFRGNTSDSDNQCSSVSRRSTSDSTVVAMEEHVSSSGEPSPMLPRKKPRAPIPHVLSKEPGERKQRQKPISNMSSDVSNADTSTYSESSAGTSPMSSISQKLKKTRLSCKDLFLSKLSPRLVGDVKAANSAEIVTGVASDGIAPDVTFITMDENVDGVHTMHGVIVGESQSVMAAINKQNELPIGIDANCDAEALEPAEKPIWNDGLEHEWSSSLRKWVVKSGTLLNLVAACVDPRSDLDYVKALRLTFRHVTAPDDLLEMLLSCFSTASTEVQIRIVHFVITWMQEAWFDFQYNTTMHELVQTLTDTIHRSRLSQLEDWLTRTWQDAINVSSDIVKEPIKPAIVGGNSASSYESTGKKCRSSFGGRGSFAGSSSKIVLEDDSDLLRRCSEPIFHSISDLADILKETGGGAIQKESVLDFSSHALADSITLVESAFFRSVRPQEFVLHLWGDKSTEIEKAKMNMKAHTMWFNKVTLFVAKEICVVIDMSRRVRVIEKLIKLAKYLLACRNFSSLFAVTAGLNHGAVIRLKVSWANVSTSSKNLFRDICALMDPSKNFANYRAYVASLDEGLPLIPLSGVTLKDLTAINERPKYIDVNEERHINFSKLWQIYLTMQRTILCHQRTRYDFVYVPQVRLYIESMKVLTDEILYAFSEKLQPRVKKQLRHSASCTWASTSANPCTKRLSVDTNNAALLNESASSPRGANSRLSITDAPSSPRNESEAKSTVA